MERSLRAFALCAIGLEKVLANELARIGLTASSRSPGRVFFEADVAGLFRANLCLRTAERVLIEAARFPAPDFDALFEGVRSVRWEDYFAEEDRLVIERVRIRDSQLSAQTSVQSVVHKAVYERLGKAYGIQRLPETGREGSARVYLEGDECLIGLDTSGEALHKRGYRKSTVEAPLKETLAAGCLLLSGWNRRIPLLDPFCGSGTILIEAALFALDIAPGLGRSFSLEDMPLADASAFKAEREAAKARVRSDEELSLAGSDIDESALASARANAERAGVGAHIAWKRGKAEDSQPPAPSGYLLCNPPYGNRLGSEEEAEALYRRLGELAPAFKGWGLGFVTNRPDFGNFFGRRATAEHKMVNGAEEQWFHWFPPGYEETEPRKTPPPEWQGKEDREKGARQGAGPGRDRPFPRRHDGDGEGRRDRPRDERYQKPGDRPGWRGQQRDDRPGRGDRDGRGGRDGRGDRDGRHGPRREGEREDYGYHGDRSTWGGFGHRNESGSRPPEHGPRPRPPYGADRDSRRGRPDDRAEGGRERREGEGRERGRPEPRRDDRYRPSPNRDGGRGDRGDRGQGWNRGGDRDRGAGREGGRDQGRDRDGDRGYRGSPQGPGSPQGRRDGYNRGPRSGSPRPAGNRFPPRRDGPPRHDGPPRREGAPRRDGPPRGGDGARRGPPREGGDSRGGPRGGDD
jgi:putative N6-adenine-specific DNA methylase